jgi:hypothetical protein
MQAIQTQASIGKMSLTQRSTFSGKSVAVARVSPKAKSAFKLNIVAAKELVVSIASLMICARTPVGVVLVDFVYATPFHPQNCANVRHSLVCSKRLGNPRLLMEHMYV